MKRRKVWDTFCNPNSNEPNGVVRAVFGYTRTRSMVEKPSSREEMRHSHGCVAGSQETDADVQRIVQSTSSLVQEQRPLLSSTGDIWCDISIGFARPVAPRQMRKTVFKAQSFQSLTNLLGTTRTRTTAYHPATNGMVERIHRTLKTTIRAQRNPQNWVASS